MKEIAMWPTWLQEQGMTEDDAPMPVWLPALRKKHRQAWQESKLPSNQDERWKYTDLAFLQTERHLRVAPAVSKNSCDAELAQPLAGEVISLVWLNGSFMPELSNLAKLPDKIIACSIQDALHLHPELIEAHFKKLQHTNAFVNLNTAMFTDGVFIFIPDNVVLNTPIHLLSMAKAGNAFVSHPHQIIQIGKNSQVTILEEHSGALAENYLKNMVTTIEVAAQAKLNYYKLQQESASAAHIANTFIFQSQDSDVALTNFSYGAQFARDEVTAYLQEPGAQCRAAGFYQLKTVNQYIDNHITFDHLAPRTQSEMLYKGVLAVKSRAVFNGRLHVAPEAKKILAYQANHNLLLANSAEVYSKPELEIYADDVKCKHGATIGQLDQEALFYLRSRGIENREATEMLLAGFADDILQRVIHPAIKTHIQSKVGGQ